MISPKSVQTHPFWKFSIKIYGLPEVEQSLLTLQNERGLNINIILFCCWYSFGDQGRFNKQEIRQIVTNIQAWHDRIVLPLRRIRQQLKPVKESKWQMVRQEVLKQELFAEQIEQHFLLEKVIFKPRPV